MNKGTSKVEFNARSASVRQADDGVWLTTYWDKGTMRDIRISATEEQAHRRAEVWCNPSKAFKLYSKGKRKSRSLWYRIKQFFTGGE